MASGGGWKDGSGFREANWGVAFRAERMAWASTRLTSRARARWRAVIQAGKYRQTQPQMAARVKSWILVSWAPEAGIPLSSGPSHSASNVRPHSPLENWLPSSSQLTRWAGPQSQRRRRLPVLTSKPAIATASGHADALDPVPSRPTGTETLAPCSKGGSKGWLPYEGWGRCLGCSVPGTARCGRAQGPTAERWASGR